MKSKRTIQRERLALIAAHMRLKPDHFNEDYNDPALCKAKRHELYIMEKTLDWVLGNINNWNPNRWGGELTCRGSVCQRPLAYAFDKCDTALNAIAGLADRRDGDA